MSGGDCLRYWETCRRARACRRATLSETTLHGDTSVERWSLDLNGARAGPGASGDAARRRALRGVVLYCHAHGNRFDIGKDELLTGRPAIATPPYGDGPSGNGLRRAGDRPLGLRRARERKRASCSTSASCGRAARYGGCALPTRWRRSTGCARRRASPACRSSHSGCRWAARWRGGPPRSSRRIAGCVDLCCLAEFEALVATGADDLHGEYYFVPGLRKHFTAAAINALIAPRPHLSCAGAQDPLTPPAGLRAIDEAMRAAYAEAGSAECLGATGLPIGASRDAGNARGGARVPRSLVRWSIVGG